MSELKTEEQKDEKTIKNDINDYYYDVIDSFTFDELLHLQNIDYEEFLLNFENDNLQQRIFNDSGILRDTYDAMMKSLYKHSTEPEKYQERSDIILAYTRSINDENAVIYHFINKSRLQKTGWLKNWSLLAIKVIIEHLEYISQGYKIRHGDWHVRYACPCDIFFKRHLWDDKQDKCVDSKEFYRCCPQCGRDTNIWTFASVRLCYLFRPPKISRIFKIKSIVDEVEMGLEVSKFKISSPVIRGD